MHQINLERPNGEPAMLDTSVSDPINQTRTQWTVFQLPEGYTVKDATMPVAIAH